MSVWKKKKLAGCYIWPEKSSPVYSPDSTHLFHSLFEKEVMSLDTPQQVQGFCNACQVRSGSRTPPGFPATTNPGQPPFSQPFLTFGPLSFPDGCNQGSHTAFLRELSPPKFLSLLVGVPTCTLLSFNKAPPLTDNTVQARQDRLKCL